MNSDQEMVETEHTESPDGTENVSVAEQSTPERATEDLAEDETPSLDLIFGILKNNRRRRVIRYLMTEEREVTLSDLAEHIAAIEHDTTPARLTSSQRKRVYVGLYQCHLPKMDDAGVIEYNQARGIIRATEHVDQYYAYLNPPTDNTGQPWYRYYLAVSGLGLLALLIGVVQSFSDIIMSGSLLAVLGVISAFSLFHWYSVIEQPQATG